MKIDRISLPIRSSCLVAGTFGWGPTSCAEGNGRMGPHHPFAPVTSRRELLAARLGQHRNSPIKQIRARTSMLLILGFAESSNDSESLFASGTRMPPGGERSFLSGRRRRLRAAGTGAYRYNDLCGAWHAVPTTPDDLCPPGRFRVILKAKTYCLRPEGSLPRNEYRPQPRGRFPTALHPSDAVRSLAPEERAVGGIS